MSEQIADQADSAATDASSIKFTLTATNGSSVPGDEYFSIFPPPLKSPAVSSQVLTALVSGATRSGQNPIPLTWNGGSGALALLAIAETGDPTKAERTPVALGDKATVTFADGAYAIAASAGGPADAIQVDFDPSVPPASLVGLVVGPAPILVGVPAGLGPLTLEPDLSSTVTAVFGTACVYPPPSMSDVDQGVVVTFAASGDTAAASAAIAVGLDNLIVQLT